LREMAFWAGEISRCSLPHYIKENLQLNIEIKFKSLVDARTCRRSDIVAILNRRVKLFNLI
jgi:hypothetical protein